MTTESNTLGSMDATTAILQAELPLLEEHQQDLERKLAAVTERLESVRAALSALRVLSSAPPVPLTAAADSEPAAGLVPSARTRSEPVTVPARRKARSSTARKGAGTTEAPAKRKTAPAARNTTAEPVETPVETPAAKAPADKTPAAKAPAVKAPAAGTPAAEPAAGDGDSLTAQVLGVVTASGSTPVRARDVAEALGRELTTSSINTVRSTLDRLVATSRAHRAGRGLYQAPLG